MKRTQKLYVHAKCPRLMEQKFQILVHSDFYVSHSWTECSGKCHHEQHHILSPGTQIKGALTLFTKYKSNSEWGSKFIVIKQWEAAFSWLLA